MINIITTIDYEIFGNAKGDVNEHIIKPMERILEIYNDYSVPLTIMFEAMEYIAYEKYDDMLIDNLGYSPKDKIKAQINKAYKKGHDVQLHIHPQFRNIKYDGKKFILDKTVKPYLDLDSHEVEKLLRKGKNTLESIIEDEYYKCRALRLSNIGWRSVPENTLEPMKKSGLIVHSLDDEPPDNKKGYWEKRDGTYEIPIHSKEVSISKFLTPKKLFIYFYLWSHGGFKIFNNDASSSGESNEENRKLRSKWDLSKLSKDEFVECLNLAKKRYDNKNQEIPLVMIGHTKDFFNKRALEGFLREVKKNMKSVAKFSTFDCFIENNLV